MNTLWLCGIAHFKNSGQKALEIRNPAWL